MDSQTIESAQALGTFDVLSFLDNISYPTAKVVVYTDAEGASKYVQLNNKRMQLAGTDSTEGTERKEEAELTKQIEELGKRISASAMIFELRGQAPEETRAVLDEPEEFNKLSDAERSRFADERDNEMIARTVTRVSNAAGVADPNPLTAATVQRLRSRLKEGEFGKLIKAVAEVNFNATVFDQATDAGFSGGSADLA